VSCVIVISLECYSGVYELQLKAFVGRAVITGPQLIVSIQPDATKPVSFNISYKPQDTYTVGTLLPGNRVTLVKQQTIIYAGEYVLVVVYITRDNT